MKELEEKVVILAMTIFLPLDDLEAIFLIDSWEDQSGFHRHHKSPLIKQISLLRDEYALHIEIKRFTADKRAS